jgi:hypothetical protein
MLYLNLEFISKCVAKCEAKYLENIQIPKETTPTAVASNRAATIDVFSLLSADP